MSITIPHIKGFEILLKQLKSQFQYETRTIKEINAGMNNKLFRLTDASGKSLLAKFYYTDDRKRLQREYTAFEYLQSRKINFTPQVYLKNNRYHFAVYSYESGKTKKAEDMTINDLDKMLEFIFALHSNKFNEAKDIFPSAVMACFSYKDYLNNITFRLKKFNDYVRSKEVHPMVLSLINEQDIVGFVQEKLKATLTSMSEKDIDTPIKDEEKKLWMVDFGPHNILFRPDNRLIFIDFEYFGWDDPARLIGDFVNHDVMQDLPHQHKQYFVESYKDKIKRQKNLLRRIDKVITLVAIEWFTILLHSITPEKIKQRQSSIKNFQQDEYINTQIGKLLKRIGSFDTYK